MTSLRVDPDTVTALGALLTSLGSDLANVDEGDPVDGMPPCRTAGAVGDLLTSWRHERLRLVGALTDLGVAAEAVARAYAGTEASVTVR